jgi:hypothetical protein
MARPSSAPTATRTGSGRAPGRPASTYPTKVAVMTTRPRDHADRHGVEELAVAEQAVLVDHVGLQERDDDEAAPEDETARLGEG